jgi:hypothetical protein
MLSSSHSASVSRAPLAARAPGPFPKLRAADHIYRAASAHLRSFVSGNRPEYEAQAMFGDDQVTDIVLKAASGQATTTTTGWAASLAGIAVYDLIRTITSLSASANLIDRALKINLDGIAEAHVPSRVVNAAAAGAWIAENSAIPVRALSFADATVLRPRKLAVITVVTREMAESSNIEAVVKQTLGEAAGLSLDLAMFSNAAGDATKPPGLFAGITPLTAATGGGTAAMFADIMNLFGALAAAGGGATAVIVAAMPQAVMLKLEAGPLFDTQILASTAISAGTVAVVEAASVVSGFGSVVDFSVSKVSALHMEDTSPATDLSGATPVRSMYQVDALSLKTQLWAAFGLRAAGHAQWIQNATW